MRKQYLRILIALIGVAGLGVAARGQAFDQIVVNMWKRGICFFCFGGCPTLVF